MIEAPIFHVNGDDPSQWRLWRRPLSSFDSSSGATSSSICTAIGGTGTMKRMSRVSPNLGCTKPFRRTRPLPRFLKSSYSASGVLTEEDADNLEKEFRRLLERALNEVQTSEVTSRKDLHRSFEESTAVFQPEYTHREPATEISKDAV